MDTLTDTLNNLISETTQSDWTNVSGGLDKVSASSMGFAWGIGKGSVWTCQLPCSGEWKVISSPETPIDIATDESHVYVLGSTTLSMKMASNVDEWITVKVSDIQKIFSTASYIWGQGSKKYKLAKPGTTGNWITVPDSKNVNITSTSSGAIYGVDPTGQAVKSDENLQSGWTNLSDFKGKYVSIIGDADQQDVYGLDVSNSLKKCMAGKCDPVTTLGYTPQNITIEPISRQLWMTTVETGNAGNIFSKSASDYSSILQTIQPFDKQRDAIAQQAEQAYKTSTSETVLQKQFENVKNTLPKVTKPVSSDLSSNLKDTQSQISQLKQSLGIVKDVSFLFLVLLVIYLFLGPLGNITHFIALCVLGAGIYFLVHKHNGV